MSNPGSSFRMAAVAEILYRSYGLPVIVEALRADTTAVAQIVVKTVEGICDIDPKSPVGLMEDPDWVRFTPNDGEPVTIKYSELSVLQTR
jgi:hypothetical protein